MNRFPLRMALAAVTTTLTLALAPTTNAQVNALPEGTTSILSGATRTVEWDVLAPSGVPGLPSEPNRLIVPVPEGARVLGTRYDTDNSEIVLGLRVPVEIVPLFQYYNRAICAQGYDRVWRTQQSGFVSAKYQKDEHELYLNISFVEYTPIAYRVELDFAFGALATPDLGTPTGCD